MARTSKGIKILNNGVVVAGNAISIDFEGAGVVGSSDGQGNVTETIAGGGASGTPVFGEVVAGSATTFTLTHTPLGTIDLAANGQVLTLAVDYTIVGAVITTLSSWSAGSVIADYSY